MCRDRQGGEDRQAPPLGLVSGLHVARRSVRRLPRPDEPHGGDGRLPPNLQQCRPVQLVSITKLIVPSGKLTALREDLIVQYDGQLGECQADALEAALLAQPNGWTGAFTNTGNIACQIPKSCVGPICQ